MTGLLQVRGSIDLTQFWPVGNSDADTSKVRVTVGDDAFRFSSNGSTNFRVVRDFRDALVRGKSGRKAILDKQSRIVVRLQAVDAPELHYQPAALRRPAERTAQQHKLYLEWNHEYRQPLAETSTLALVKKLAAAAHDQKVSCVVRSYGDQPADFFDTYGRLVGEIVVAERSVNRWLLAQGWALPALYNSMSRGEIESAIDAANEAWADDRGVWPSYSDSCSRFDFDLRYRGTKAAVEPDPGKVLVPKIFRRLSTWKVNVKSKMFAGTFREYLQSAPDVCFTTESFLQQLGAAPAVRLLDLVQGNRITVWPEEIVFKDSPSQVVDAAGDVVTW